MNTTDPHRFKLGDRVTFTGIIEKVRRDDLTLYEPARPPLCYDKWNEAPRPYTEGIIVGRRTVQPGRVEAQTEFDGYSRFITVGLNEFIPTEGAAFRVWLVAFDLRRKPVMVADDQVEAAA